MAAADGRVLGSASVSLRPLRFLFDVEADVTIEPTEAASISGVVHMLLRISSRPPALKQHAELGFLRSEAPVHTADKEDKLESDADGSDSKIDDSPELSKLRGSFAWLLVRVQPRAECRLPPGVRVQYQAFPSSESFCLPADHTNVVRLLVTDEVLAHVDVSDLRIRFLPPADPQIESPAPPVSTPSPSHFIEKQHASEAKAVEYDDAREAAAVARAVALVERDRDVRAEQKDRERSTELSKAQLAFAQDRAALERELAVARERQLALEQQAAALEAQLRATGDHSRGLQAASNATDQAIEMLRQRAAADALEREELQRRLHALEDEKLALLRKSRACCLQ